MRNCYATSLIQGSTSDTTVAGLVGSSSSAGISDSFFLGAVINDDPSGPAFGITINGSNLTNLFWDNSVAGSEAVTCYSGGDIGCAIETDQTVFFSPAHPVYTRAQL